MWLERPVNQPKQRLSHRFLSYSFFRRVVEQFIDWLVSGRLCFLPVQAYFRCAVLTSLVVVHCIACSNRTFARGSCRARPSSSAASAPVLGCTLFRYSIHKTDQYRHRQDTLLFQHLRTHGVTQRRLYTIHHLNARFGSHGEFSFL